MNQLLKVTSFFFLALLASCASKDLMERMPKQQISVTPDILEVYRDTVRFQVEAVIPRYSLPKGSVYELTPEYHFKGRFDRLEGSMKVDADTIDMESSVTMRGNYKFPFEDLHEKGEIRFRATLTDKKKGKILHGLTEPRAIGVINTQRLVRLGQFEIDEPVSRIGVLMAPDYDDYAEEGSVSFDALFGLGTDSLIQVRSMTPGVLSLESFLAAPHTIKEIAVKGYLSPEGEERAQPNLSTRRAKALENYFKDQVKEYSFQEGLGQMAISSIRGEDEWARFREVLRYYDGLTLEQKDAYFNAVYEPETYREQLATLQRQRGFQKVQQEVFPKMRSAKLEFVIDKEKKSDPEIAVRMRRLLKGQEVATGLSSEEMAYAATLTPDLDEREAIYLLLTQYYPSDMAFNNLGWVYLNRANRTFELAERYRLVNQAIRAFEKANEATDGGIAEVTHNLGQAFVLLGDFQSAYLALSKAAALSDRDYFFGVNESLRGALDIWNGDYRLAAQRLKEAPDTDMNLFNQGLAYFLDKDYLNASIAFEESAMRDREYGYSFYGLSLIAARSGNEEALYEFLPKAVKYSTILKQRAAQDLEFRPYFGKEGFREAIR
ncbi:tetratricopeptide repeat protein [Pararhodonellum marinum]|uniref:tetratricopeptide repeat protein n=1 Tax=Pararhodonellum marinum TaxID=2755358 RepID=UPI00188F33CC|nr:tetratricopeptide repeat protein [Pararhodonellum marinum]